MVRNNKVLVWGVVSTSPNPQSGWQPLVDCPCPRLLIQYIRSYTSYLEAVFPTATWGRPMTWKQDPLITADVGTFRTSVTTSNPARTQYYYKLQPTRCNFTWIYFYRRSACFKPFLRPSSGAHNCTYSFRYCQPILLLAATVEEMALVQSPPR